MMKKSPRVALVHDYLREFGGAERVLEALHEIWPEAPVYVGFIDREALGIHAQRFKDWNIKETWIARLPFYKKLFSPYRIFARAAFSSLDLSEFDVVISSSNAYMAKAVRVPNGKHLCYCHTPPRSLYGYTTMTDWKKNPITRIAGQLINHVMRNWDFVVAQKVDVFIANSEETKKRIKKFYRRESQVIYPPVELVEQAQSRQPSDQLSLVNQKTDYFLYVGRLAKSKNVDLAIEACTKLNVPLKLVGSGQGLAHLQSLAGPTVEFLGAVSDENLHDLYAEAKALIFPAEDEDFGIVPVEAMGHGLPVIAHRSGGPQETIVENKTGVFFDELSIESLVGAIGKLNELKFDRQVIRRQAEKFSREVFVKQIKKLVTELI